jgi:putative ABC transport system substrate-binding protein
MLIAISESRRPRRNSVRYPVNAGFVVTADPVSNGFVMSMARPGGNITGFSFIEHGIAGKWLELLKQMAPGVTRVAVLREVPIGLGQLGVIQAVAPLFGVELFPIDVSSPDQIERAVSEFARGSNGGLIVTAGGVVIVHRKLFISLATRHRLPTVYWNRMYVADGSLISYGPDTIDQYHRAAAYVDRILKGEKPADLPVQAPTRYDLAINLKTARTLGLEVPPTLLATANEVID